MLQGRTYVPMLHARLAEMRALRELPDASKNKLFPVIKARPWLNAQSLDRLWETISAAFPNRSFALDLDRTKFDPNSDRPAYQQFAALFEPNNGYEAYYNKVREIGHAVPVLRYEPDEPIQINEQLNWAEDLDRGLVVRVLTRAPGPFAQVVAECSERDLENVVFVIDAGWGRDILLQAATCVSLISTVAAQNEEFEIVVGGSSFPDSFTKQGERFYTWIIERQLFNQVRRNVNVGTLYYGDWGSTRPPTDPVPMRNIPRIDMSTAANWLSWRSDGSENYEALAERVTEDDDWSGNLGIWGEYMIQCTADGLSPAIGSPAMAAAVRVNMHLHFQANFDTPDDLVVPDEPFDDL